MEDATLCEIIPVILPEEVGVNDTIGFVSDLDHLGLSVQRIAVNIVMPKMVGSELAGHVEAARKKSELPSWLVPPATALARQRMQQQSIELLSAVEQVDTILLPLIQDAVLDSASMKRLTKAFSTSIGR
jgi:hypothetical protein